MMSNKIPPTEPSKIIESATELTQKDSEIYFNLGQAYIMTTEDKVLICLTKHLSRMENKKAWLTPLGILLTIIVVFPTTNFQPFLFMSADTWMAIFIISGLLSVGWLIYAFFQSRDSTSIDEVVAEIRESAISSSEKSRRKFSDDLFILSAIYGAEDSFMDVTQLLNSYIKDGKLVFTVSNDSLGGDPIPYQPKKLEVEYTYAGDIHIKVVNEGKLLTLP